MDSCDHILRTIFLLYFELLIPDGGSECPGNCCQGEFATGFPKKCVSIYEIQVRKPTLKIYQK